MNKKRLIIISSLLALLGLTGLLIFNKANSPKIILNGEEHIKLAFGEEYIELGAKATIRNKDISDSIKIENKIDLETLGIFEVEYSVVYRSNKVTVTRTVEIFDDVPPVITLKGNEEIIIHVGQTYTEPGFIAEDNYDGDITEKVEVISEVDNEKEGTYRIIYRVVDSSGNVAEVERIVIVRPRPTGNNINRNVRGLPILMYHNFFDASLGETGPNSNWMEITDFYNQVKYLSENNYYYPSWSEVREFVEGTRVLPDRSVIITVDDGHESFFRLALPILIKYNVKATSFVVTSWTSVETMNTYRSELLDFQSHSHDMHSAGSDGRGRILTYSGALEDLRTSANLIGANDVFCYPFGHFNDAAKQTLTEAGFGLALTTQGGRVFPGMDPLQLPRVRMSLGDSLASFIDRVR